MLNISCEVMGASWRGQPNRQDDAILIQDRLLQHDNKITQCYQLTDGLCVAVADGVHSSPAANQASKQVVSSVRAQYQAGGQVSIHAVQTSLCHALADHPHTHGASSTLAMVQSMNGTTATKQQLRVQHVGDSRVYHYRQQHGWQQLTQDHSAMQQMISDGIINPDQDIDYASMYYALNHYLVADWSDHNIDGLFGQTIEVVQGDWIVLCTDGVHDIVSAEQWPMITPHITLKDWLQALFQVIRQQGADDNGSVIVVRWGEHGFDGCGLNSRVNTRF